MAEGSEVKNKKEEVGKHLSGREKFAIARTRSPARETRALPGTHFTSASMGSRVKRFAHAAKGWARWQASLVCGTGDACLILTPDKPAAGRVKRFAHAAKGWARW